MNRILFAGAALALGLMCGPARAEPTGEQATTEETPWYKDWWNTAKTETTSILRDGGWDLYFPAAEYHMPWAYDKEARSTLNQSPMPAFGLGRGQHLENGNWQGLYVMGFRDSHDFASWTVGYNYLWLWDLPAGVHGGFGATAFVMTRQDYDYVPFPAILPTAHLGYKNLSVEASYVPAYKHGTGNVLFIWFKLEEKGRPGS
ncbi:hypothetical protein [Niveibacterium sp. SC-1]|uniref:hypothetical protein n=1 Tax=Niveibacterium sp. SC-1 TaxID=3135646 RepID=UPI00311EB7A7